VGTTGSGRMGTGWVRGRFRGSPGV
jgi:hypothetical protein